MTATITGLFLDGAAPAAATSMNDTTHAMFRSEEEQMDQEPDRPEDESGQQANDRPPKSSQEDDSLLQELVAYLRDNRTELREEWARRISEAELLGVMSDEEIFSEATEVYDNT